MKVLKRDGSYEEMRYDKITKRISALCTDLNLEYVDPTLITLKVTQGIYDGITTNELDILASQTAASMVITHPDYGRLAGRIVVTLLHKNTPKKFSSAIKELYNFVEPKTNKKSSLIGDDIYKFVMENKDLLDSYIDITRDYNFDYFGIKTLERSYLLKIGERIIERPQYMYMRVAVGIANGNINEVFRIYDDLSNHIYTHATPTLFNAGTPRPQMSSCFLVANKDDSIDGLFDTLKDVAKISKWAGGIGLHVHNVRASGAYIAGTGGQSDGLLPMLKTYNEVARWINQCFSPETLLYTNEGIKRIDEIKTGDLVLNKDQQYCEVGEVFVYDQSGGMLEIKTKSSLKSLMLTDAHPLFGFKNFNKVSSSQLLNELEKNNITPSWIESGSYERGDFIGRPIPKEVIDVEYMTEDDLFLYGLILGSGNVTMGNVEILFSGDDEINFIKKYLKDRDINFKENNNIINFPLSKLYWLDYEYLYNDKIQKRIHPNLSHLPLNKTIKLILGLVKSKSGKYGENGIRFRNDSEELIEGLSYQILRFGVPTYGEWINSKRYGYVCDLNIPAFDKLASLLNLQPYLKRNWLVWEGVLFTKIVSAKKLEKYEGKVYDLKIKNEFDDPSYTLVNCLVHNGGKRKGSFAIYLEPWHADILEFLDLRKNHGKEEFRARDLFLALWVPNLFMERVEADGDWSLFSPDEAPNLYEVYDTPEDKPFTRLYEQYEAQGLARTKMKARKLMDAILTAQIETGVPYMLYKDHANYKSNQKNLGTIKSSNLCLDGDSMVDVLLNGVTQQLKISTVVELYKDGVDLQVLSYSLKDGREEFCDITNGALMNPSSEVLKITDEVSGHQLICTPDHQIFTKNRGYVMAKHLNEDDILQILS